MNTISLPRPDDLHIHLRHGDFLARTVPDCAKQFARVLVMPNLPEPVSTTARAQDYHQAIMDTHRSSDYAAYDFTPLMSLYLTDTTTADHVREAADSPIVYAFKLYPAGVTTLSDKGVHDIAHLYPIFEAMSKTDLLLLIHGEVSDGHTDIFDREQRFIESVLAPIVDTFPKLKVVLEHITTQDAVQFVESAPQNVAATITAHHLSLNRNDLLSGGIKPHYYCLPIVKRQSHMLALREVATSGNPKFFLGSDSAPHPQSQKESPCGCAGIYTGYNTLEIYAHLFDEMGAMDKLPDFASRFGANFYGLPISDQTVTLNKTSHEVPSSLPYADGQLIPFMAGQSLSWQLAQAD